MIAPGLPLSELKLMSLSELEQWHRDCIEVYQQMNGASE